MKSQPAPRVPAISSIVSSSAGRGSSATCRIRQRTGSLFQSASRKVAVWSSNRPRFTWTSSTRPSKTKNL
jgi:hypothetical protein